MDLSLLELENYWLPLIWAVGGGILFNMLPKTDLLIAGKVETRWYWFSAVMVVLPLIVWAGARTSFGDTGAYRRSFANAPSSFMDLPAYMARTTEDRVFYLIMALWKCLGMRTDTSFLMFIAAVQMLCMVKSFRKYANDYWICIFLFVASTDYMSWMFNGIRQFLAATIIFGAFGLLVRKKYIAYSLIVLFASTIHASALLMLPLSYIMIGPAMNKKTLLMILGVAVVVPFVDSFMPFLDALLADTQYGGITTDEIWSVDDGTNIFRVLVYSVPALLAIFGRRYIVRTNDPVLNLCVNASLITMAIYLVSSVTSGIYVGRLPIYTTLHGYIALPWLIDQIFEKQSAKLIKFLMVGFYFAFYYYQMGMAWSFL